MTYTEIYNMIKAEADNEKNRVILKYCGTCNTGKVYRFTDENDFENAVKGVINYKWKEQHPEHFTHMYVDGAPFCPIGYSLYDMIMKNSVFNHLEYGTGHKAYEQLVKTDGEFFGNILYQDRLHAVINKAKSSDNIMDWAIEHFNQKYN